MEIVGPREKQSASVKSALIDWPSISVRQLVKPC
jgi:hypothetical protein